MKNDNITVKSTMLGAITNNPVFVLVLGMCPTLAMTSNLKNSFWLSVSTMVVLVMSNTVISLMRKVIPDKVRIPAYIIMIATLTTLVDMILAFYLPAVHKNISRFIALIAVNCIILARAEGFAKHNGVGMSALDGVAMGLGFIVALCFIGVIREILGSGAIWGIILWDFKIPFFTTPSGGFITLGLLMGAFNYFYNKIKGKHTIRNKMTERMEAAKNA